MFSFSFFSPLCLCVFVLFAQLDVLLCVRVCACFFCCLCLSVSL
jgi:hypothetical protein